MSAAARRAARLPAPGLKAARPGPAAYEKTCWEAALERLGTSPVFGPTFGTGDGLVVLDKAFDRAACGVALALSPVFTDDLAARWADDALDMLRLARWLLEGYAALSPRELRSLGVTPARVASTQAMLEAFASALVGAGRDRGEPQAEQAVQRLVEQAKREGRRASVAVLEPDPSGAESIVVTLWSAEQSARIFGEGAP